MYDVLGVSKDATPDEIKKAYRKLVMQHHPDKGGDPEQFKKIQSAYEILSDPAKRQNFDQFGDPDGPSQMNGGFPGGFPGDIFSSMFGGGGGGPRGPTRRADHRHNIEISLDDAYNGIRKNIRISLTKPCFDCMKPCQACKGQGKIQHQLQMGPFSQMFAQPCSACNQNGKVSSGCSVCKQAKVKIENLNFEFELPPGVQDGHKITVRGLGEQPQLPSGEEPGDLILIIKIKYHPVFARIGNDILWHPKISFESSVNGAKLTCPHFSGEFEVDTGKWGPLDPRREYVIERKGIPAGKGHLKCVFDIQYPNSPVKYLVTQV